jgi:uncharacterized protein YbcV (DUF1398 family)
MNARQKMLAQDCLEAAETNTLTFPQIVGVLMEGGFESYLIDFRRATATYYLPDGDSITLPAHRTLDDVVEALDADALRTAIREAQALAPGYTYRGFCEKAKACGCAGYMVSFSGRRAIYFGRDGASHTEHFPNSN